MPAARPTHPPSWGRVCVVVVHRMCRVFARYLKRLQALGGPKPPAPVGRHIPGLPPPGAARGSGFSQTLSPAMAAAMALLAKAASERSLAAQTQAQTGTSPFAGKVSFGPAPEVLAQSPADEQQPQGAASSPRTGTGSATVDMVPPEAGAGSGAPPSDADVSVQERCLEGLAVSLIRHLTAGGGHAEGAAPQVGPTRTH